MILTSTTVTFTREEDDAIQSEIKQLRERNNFLSQQVVELGHEVKRLKADNSLLLMYPGAVECDVRDMMEPCEPPELSEFPSKQV